MQVRAENAIGEGDWSSATLKGTPAVQNVDPTFDEGDAANREVVENRPVRSNVGGRITAADSDRDTLTYSILGGHRLFEIDATTGQIRTKEALDHDTEPSHLLTVDVSDMLNSSDDPDPTIDDTIQVTIAVTNVNEPPVVTRRSGTGDFSIEENSGTAVGDFDATDPEGSGVTWSLATSGDYRRFEIDETSGALSFDENGPPDFESADLGNDVRPITSPCGPPRPTTGTR